MEKKFVWVVMSGCKGDEGIHSIHWTEPGAQEEVDNINKTHYGRTTTPWIEKWEVK